ncbi:M67 family metallopeptidase [Sphingomonas sp. H39-1-10]|uniref:M67 family metallopeptidase n=1 Tax=Sphingomonas pollutisoli TaxID=3030829 RepID=UPI0023B9318D|nr:M67 family metallopeptidase [Sphingomonas pollutisoli]MDF0489334.1 M67 family metallopeptidase [Sphingomonas pollutisoli]
MLEISSTALHRIIAAAHADGAREVCGLLFGDHTRIAWAEPCANVADDPARTFEIDPAAHFAALRAERAGGAKLIGYWHSHPSGDVRPSATDVAMAAADGKLWLITAGSAIGVWRAEGGDAHHRFVAVPYRIAAAT